LVPQLRKTEVDLYLPKFTVESKHNLINTIKMTGIRDLFDPNNANLYNISKPVNNKHLYVSQVLQNAKIIVDENGTEASAATAMTMMFNCATNKPKSVLFKANHPFTYYIRDTSLNLIYFMGQLL
jgi:serine protease inhibitor